MPDSYDRRDGDAARQLDWSRRYLRREKRRRVLLRVLLVLVLALVCAATVFAVNGLPALRANASAPGSSFAPSSVSAAAPAGSADASSQGSSASAPQVRSCTVTFDSRGGSAVAALENVTAGARIARPEAPQRAGYVFAGWYRDEARTQAWDFDADTVQEDITLYADWQAAPVQDADGEALPQTGVASGAMLWGVMLAAALCLAAAAAAALRRAYHRR